MPLLKGPNKGSTTCTCTRQAETSVCERKKDLMAQTADSSRWSLKDMTALVTGGTKGIGFLLSFPSLVFLFLLLFFFTHNISLLVLYFTICREVGLV